MANDLNRVMLVGRLVKDPDLRYIPSGPSVASFSLANNKTYTKDGQKNDSVSYFECVAWGKLAEIVAQYSKKGKLIGIDGRLQQRSWEDKDGNKRYKVEIIVEHFQLLTPLDQQDKAKEGEYYPPATTGFDDAAPADMENPFSDDDIPF